MNNHLSSTIITILNNDLLSAYIFVVLHLHFFFQTNVILDSQRTELTLHLWQLSLNNLQSLFGSIQASIIYDYMSYLIYAYEQSSLIYDNNNS